MPDNFANMHPGLSDVASHAAAVTPDDAADLTTPARGLYVGGAGNVELDTVGGETVVFTGVPEGTVLPIRCTRVRAANTSATAIVALW